MDINNLKKAREAAHYTQSQAAAVLGISDGTYKNYEQGKREPNNALLSKIADLYHVSTDYLLGREKPTPNPVTLLNLPDDTEAVVDAISKLPPTTQKIMVDLLLQLSEAVKERRGTDVKAVVNDSIQETVYPTAPPSTNANNTIPVWQAARGGGPDGIVEMTKEEWEAIENLPDVDPSYFDTP